MRKGIKTGLKKDHPRVCGEQSCFKLDVQPMIGSPPRVRGTVPAVVVFSRQHRITPACAGNSAYVDIELYVKQDHPRVCGEQPDGIATEPGVIGSPPRVRGTG